MDKTKAKSLLTILLMITVIFASQLSKIQFNYDFDMFFPQGDNDFEYYSEFRDKFGTDNDNLLVAIPEENWHQANFLQKLDSVVGILENWPEIKRIQSLTNLYRYQISPLGANKISIINPDKNLDTASFFKKHLFVHQFIAEDKRSVAMNIEHIPFSLKNEADAFYDNLEGFLTAAFGELIISGKIEAQYYFVKKLEKELSLFLVLSIILISIVLFLIFKTVKGVVLPFSVLIVASIWNLGLISVLGKELDVMMVMVPPILLVVAMSDVIHFCSKYNELKSIGISTAEAIRITLKSVGAATFLTSISTAVGFATLTISPMAPIRDFGLYTAIGVLITYLVTFAFLPALLTLFDKPLVKSLSSEIRWSRKMHDLLRFVIRRRKSILRIAPILTILLASGIFYLRQNTFIVVGLKKSDPLLEKIQFFDDQYGGSKSFEMVLSLKGMDLFDEQSMLALEKITHYLTNEYGLNYPISAIEVIKELNQGFHAGQAEYRRLPESRGEVNRIRRLYLGPGFKDIRSKLQTEDGTEIRISARSKDIGSYQARRKNAGLANFFKNEINEELITYRLTGTSYLVDNTDNYVVNNLIKGLAIGLLIISLFLAILFRDLKLTLISLIPNFMPLLVLAGILGFLNVDLNLTTMLIFGIAFGIAVDDSIHLLSRFQQERNLGRSELYAIKRTFISTGKSIVLTTIILSAGFGLFIFSSFSATYYTGVFVGFTLLIALVADLMVLPLLLLRRPSKKIKARQD